MGAKISLKNRNGVRLTNDKCYSTDSNRNQFKLEAVVLSRDEVDEILENSAYETGTYILYEEPERKKTFLAFKTVDEKIAHYAIVKANDLYYFNDFPFPYLESIVLYYKKYKFKGTQLTKQAAVVSPQLRLQENRASAKSLSASADFLNDNDQTWTSANEKTWTYGHYDILSTRL